MDIQFYPEELDWVNATQSVRRPGDKSFLGFVCDAALRADPQNYELMRPFLKLMMRKYPAGPDRLEAEQRDR